MADLAVVIPAYEPDETLSQLVEELRGFFEKTSDKNAAIVIVDDGTQGEIGRQTIARCAEVGGVVVLSHDRNRGKGAAIKTALQYALANHLNFVVTADADGQHLPKDIMAMCATVRETDRYTLGVRKFDNNVPLRSRIGNGFTSKIVQWMFKTKLEDTQSGLRGIPARYFPTLLKIAENGYEFEFRSLVDLLRARDVDQMPISTVYEPGNPSSHFKPIRGSALIYMVLLRYLFFVPLVSGFDILAFWILSGYLEASSAFAIARSVSVLVYFVVIRRFVFQATSHAVPQFFGFLALALFNIVCTASLFRLFQDVLPNSSIFIYVAATVVLFFFNFAVQRSIIFADKNLGQS